MLVEIDDRKIGYRYDALAGIAARFAEGEELLDVELARQSHTDNTITPWAWR
jgi:hypothetical protein